MNISPGMKVVVSIEGQSTLVQVTGTNLATLFDGQPYDPKTETWLPGQVYMYEQILGVVEKLKEPTAPT